MSSESDSVVTGPLLKHARHRGALASHVRVIVVMLAAVAAQLALVAAFTGAMSKPTLQDVTVGIVVPVGSNSAAVASAIAPIPGVSYRAIPDTATAQAAVDDGDIPAAVVVDDAGETLYVAGAFGPSLIGAVESSVAASAEHAGRPVRTVDVHPLPPADRRGMGTFLLAIGWVIGGYLGMMLLTRVMGGASRTPRGVITLMGWTAAYAVSSAILGVVLLDPVMGVVTGAPWALIGAGSLIVFSVGIFTAALLSLWGMPGLVVAIGTLVILGNPTSGGSVPAQMLTGGWRFLASILPTNAAVSLIRAVTYFNGHHLVTALMVLVIYGAACALLLLRLSRNRTIRPTAPAGSQPQMAAPRAVVG